MNLVALRQLKVTKSAFYFAQIQSKIAILLQFSLVTNCHFCHDK